MTELRGVGALAALADAEPMVDDPKPMPDEDEAERVVREHTAPDVSGDDATMLNPDDGGGPDAKSPDQNGDIQPVM